MPIIGESHFGARGLPGKDNASKKIDNIQKIDNHPESNTPLAEDLANFTYFNFFGYCFESYFWAPWIPPHGSLRYSLLGMARNLKTTCHQHHGCLRPLRCRLVAMAYHAQRGGRPNGSKKGARRVQEAQKRRFAPWKVMKKLW